jgi:hypothetical protein
VWYLASEVSPHLRKREVMEEVVFCHLPGIKGHCCGHMMWAPCLLNSVKPWLALLPRTQEGVVNYDDFPLTTSVTRKSTENAESSTLPAALVIHTSAMADILH